MTYTTIQPPFSLVFREMPKEELRRYFEWFMQVRAQRLDELTSAVTETLTYEKWEPDGTPSSLDSLGRWFSERASVRARSVEELNHIEKRLVFPMAVSNEELTTSTLSQAMDIGMYFSQVFQKNHPNLRWDQPLASKNFIDYGQPVLVKFKPGPLNPVRMVVTFAYGLVSGHKTGTGLRDIYDIWSKLIQ